MLQTKIVSLENTPLFFSKKKFKVALEQAEKIFSQALQFPHSELSDLKGYFSYALYQCHTLLEEDKGDSVGVANLLGEPLSKAELVRRLDLPYKRDLFLNYFPFAFERARHLLSIAECIDLLIEPAGSTNQIMNFLLWFPIIKKYLPPEILTKQINKLLTSSESKNQRTNVWLLQELLPLWVNYVDCHFANQVVGHLGFSVHREEKSLLSFSNNTLWKELPEKVKAFLTLRYIQKPWEEIPITTKIALIPQTDYKISTCEYCTISHYNVLNERHLRSDHENHHFAKTIILRVDGAAVFSMKMLNGTASVNSMLALNTWKTPYGRLAIVRGGVYFPTLLLQKEIQKAYFTEQRLTPNAETFPWIVLDVDSIRAVPTVFINQPTSQKEAPHPVTGLPEPTPMPLPQLEDFLSLLASLSEQLSIKE